MYGPILHRTPITTSSKVNRTPRSNSYKRTFCSSRANTAPVPYIQPTKINARPCIMIKVAVYSESKMVHEWGKITLGPILHPTPITASSKANHTPRSNSYRRTTCSSGHPFYTFNQPISMQGHTLSTLWCIRKAKWRINEVKLHIGGPILHLSNANNSFE